NGERVRLEELQQVVVERVVDALVPRRNSWRLADDLIGEPPLGAQGMQAEALEERRQQPGLEILNVDVLPQVHQAEAVGQDQRIVSRPETVAGAQAERVEVGGCPTEGKGVPLHEGVRSVRRVEKPYAARQVGLQLHALAGAQPRGL